MKAENLFTDFTTFGWWAVAIAMIGVAAVTVRGYLYDLFVFIKSERDWRRNILEHPDFENVMALVERQCQSVDEHAVEQMLGDYRSRGKEDWFSDYVSVIRKKYGRKGLKVGHIAWISKQDSEGLSISKKTKIPSFKFVRHGNPLLFLFGAGRNVIIDQRLEIMEELQKHTND